MENLYLGTLPYTDPMYGILYTRACPDVKDPVFHVSLTSSRRVYKYTEEKTRTAVIGKFFRPDDTKAERVLRIKGEYDNLQRIRAYGFDTYPYYVVRPMGREERIGLALIEEFIRGKNLDYFIRAAIYGGEGPLLLDVLSRLASFLYAFHARTRIRQDVELDPVCSYYEKVLLKLVKHETINKHEKKTFLKMMDKWLALPLLREAASTIIHGDATPTNFIFTSGGDVVAIDLERMKEADAVFDIGMVCGELKHAFLWRTGNAYMAEPFITYFLKSYARLFSHEGVFNVFRETTLRNPFYMALAELRIARNSYLGRHYRMKIAHEALKCLKWGLMLR